MKFWEWVNCKQYSPRQFVAAWAGYRRADLS